MFGFFKKRPAAPSGAVNVPDLHFKSASAAFEYACEFMDNSLAGGAPVPAVVLHVNETGSCVVKIANNKDKSIPTGPVRSFLESGDIEHISVRTDSLGNVGRIEVGDLVSFFRPKELEAAPILMGFINARLLPQYSMVHQGWKIAGPR